MFYTTLGKTFFETRAYWVHSINLDFVDFTDFWMSWRIRLILISFCFRRFANQWNLRNPAPELDFSQISLISTVRGKPESWTWRLKAAVVIQRTPHCCLFLTTTCFDLLWVWPRRCRTWSKRNRDRELQLMFGLQARTKQTNFLRLLKGEGDEQGFFTRVKAKKFSRGKAMARRRLQRHCETKGRRLKTTPCTWSGSFHDELCDPREGGLDQAVNLCGKWVTCPSHPFNCIYGVFVRLRLVPFLTRRQCSAACVDPLRCFRPVPGTCKSTPCLVTMAEEKRHEVSFE